MALTARLLDILRRMPKADPRALIEPFEPGFAPGAIDGLEPPSWAGSATEPLRRAGDLRSAAAARLLSSRRLGIERVEMVFCPQSRLSRPGELSSALDGLLEALQEARERLDLSCGLILALSRPPAGSGAAPSLAIERCAAYLPAIAAIEIDASDPAALEAIPPELARAMARRDGSAPRLIARAGAREPAEDLARALWRMGADRFHRAALAIENPRLLSDLADSRAPLTLCPVEEARLPGIGALERHPLPELLERRALAAIASDRPAPAAYGLLDNLIAAFDALPLSESSARELALNSFEASLARDEEKKKGAERVNAFFDALPPPEAAERALAPL